MLVNWVCQHVLCFLLLGRRMYFRDDTEYILLSDTWWRLDLGRIWDGSSPAAGTALSLSLRFVDFGATNQLDLYLALIQTEWNLHHRRRCPYMLDDIRTAISKRWSEITLTRFAWGSSRVQAGATRCDVVLETECFVQENSCHLLRLTITTLQSDHEVFWADWRRLVIRYIFVLWKFTSLSNTVDFVAFEVLMRCLNLAPLELEGQHWSYNHS